jgi:hypothetical protein
MGKIKSEYRDKRKNVFTKDGTDLLISLQAHKYCLSGRRNQEEEVLEPEYAIRLIHELMMSNKSLSLPDVFNDRLCGLMVRVPGYRSRGPGFDYRRYQIF